jgi:hypothetical protein
MLQRAFRGRRYAKGLARVSDDGGGRIHGCGGGFGDHLRSAGREQAPERRGLIGTFDGQYPYCSGTLISPTVFLTAAHCGDDGSTVYVTFASTYTSKSKLYTGTFYSNARYPGPQDDPYDIAVVVFDKPLAVTQASLTTYMKLPKTASFEVLLDTVL